jgi:hypothetical protein
VVIVNVPVVPVTVVLAGTVAAALLLLSDTDTPPLGPALPRVTVPLAEIPPVTLVGAIDSAVTVGALTVRLVV